MTLIDANIVLRYLLNDHAEMSVRARDILNGGPVLILTQVVAETIYVLGGVYGIERPDITAALQKVIALPTVQLENSDTVIIAIDEFAASKLDFVDLLLYANHQITGQPVETFDKALKRLLARG
jgi:predicted nucleic-acid-binding protein